MPRDNRLTFISPLQPTIGAMRVDFRDLPTFLRAYANGPLTRNQVHDRLLGWNMKKIYSLRRISLKEGLLELDHTGREEGWHPRPSNYHRLTTKGQKLLETMEQPTPYQRSRQKIQQRPKKGT